MDEKPQYEVGFGKPPKKNQFEKGRSGNPKGRPKGSRSVAKMFTDITHELIQVKENGRNRTMTKIEAILHQLMNKALSGDPKAMKEILICNRVFEATGEAESEPVALDERDQAAMEGMDDWYGRVEGVSTDPAVKAALNRDRSRLQATLAACIIVHAEPKQALEVALERASDAIALLRFLSAANLTCKIRSYVTPLGMQCEDTFSALTITDGIIRKLTDRKLRPDTQETGWNVDRCRQAAPGLLELLHDLALDNASTELRRSLFESLLIYSKNTLTLDPAEKLIFVLVCLESLLIRDGNEAIQGNLAERLAFLVGQTLEVRKKVVVSTKNAYALRSKFVHHGRVVDDVDSLDEFLSFAWQALIGILQNMNNFESREKLISYLNDRRLS